MAIIDTNYKKYNINKLPRNKYERGNSTSVVKTGGTSSSSTSSQSNISVNGFVGRYLWGQYFDDTEDIQGSLSNVTDINMTGNLTITGSSGIITAPNAQIESATIDTLEGGSANFNELNANTGDISYLHTNTINNTNGITTNGLEAQSLTAIEGNINTLTSDNIWTRNLTVAGSAHFFELVIDKIKSVGGNALLTPADGFKIYAIRERQGNKIELYFLAEDDDGNKIRNMWEQGDQALVQDFNNATSGTNYNVSNTYFWGDVLEVKNGTTLDIVTASGTVADPNTFHSIVVSTASGACTGSYQSIYEGAECVMLGNKTNTERQTAIYISAYSADSGAYDPDLKAPFLAYYEGINDFDLGSHKKQWWSSGSRTSGVPQNKMVGEFVLNAGQTIEEYIDQNIKDADINMYNVVGGSNIWMVKTENNYNISEGGQTWNTNVKLTKNGGYWNISDIEAYRVYDGISGPSTMSELASGCWSYTKLNADGTIMSTGSSNYYNIGLSGPTAVIPGWYGTNDQKVRFKIYYKEQDGTTTGSYDYDVQLVKMPKGENGLATQVAMTQYSLCPDQEHCYVDASGNMTLYARYSLKRVATDAQGDTVINTTYSIPSGYTVRYGDDESIRFNRSASITSNNTYFNISVSDYFDGTQYSDYIEAMDDLAAPQYITIELLNGNTVIDRRTITVEFLTGSVFQVKEDAITLAVSNSLSGSKAYTDGQISTVANNISSLELDVSGIRGRVGSLETEYDDLSGVVATKADQSALSQTADTINARVTSTTETLQGNIDNVDGKFANYYDKTTTEGLITVSADNVALAVKTDINGELNETGIDIENKKITINSENTDFLGNINMHNPNEGLILYDEDGNVTVGILNANVTTNSDYFNIKNDSKLEAKSQGSSFTYSHSFELGVYSANDYIDVYYLRAMLSQNAEKCALNSVAYSYTLRRGTTSVNTGSGSFDIDYKSNATVERVISQYKSTALGTYYIDFIITYNTTNILSGYLTSNVAFYHSNKDVTNVQMIGNDGVIFKTDTNRKLIVGDEITLQNGISNSIKLEEDKALRQPTNYNNLNNVKQYMELSSTYSYRTVTSNYTATAEDAVIYIKGAYTVTLPTFNNNWIGKSYYISSNNTNAILTAVGGIHYNGRSSASENIKLSSYYVYHVIAFPEMGWIIVGDSSF